MNVSSRQKGFLLPTLTSVTVILLILATALLSSGTSSLRVATHDQQSDQALFAAEAGLVRATAEYAKGGKLESPYEKDLESSGCRYKVTITENIEGANPNVPGGPTIPTKTVYFLSRGYSENGTYRETAALFEYGMEAFTVGALGKEGVTITKSDLDAYDSAKGDYGPDTLQNDLPLLATNQGTGTPIKLNEATLLGDIFVGPHGDDKQVEDLGASTFGDVIALSDIITPEKIDVPDDDSSSDGAWNIAPIGDLELINVDSDGVYHFDDGQGLKFSVDPDKIDINDPDKSRKAVTTTNKVLAGIDTADGLPSLYIEIQVSTSQTLLVRRTGDGTGQSEVHYRNSTSAAITDYSAPSAQSLGNLFFGTERPGTSGGSDRNLINPGQIRPGHYDSITIDDLGLESSLAESGVYVIKNLNISPGSALALNDSDLDVTIYVTESMKVDGIDTIVNTSKRAPRMKILYTGTDPVDLQGGSRSYYTLIGPDAKINLRSLELSSKTHFYGALAGNSVEITNAMFHFDVDTKGIGTGTRGTGILLMNRHRL